MPPPLPSRATYADPGNFGADAQRISTRDVQRASGTTEGFEVHFDSSNVEKAKVEPQYDLKGQKTGVGLITIWFVTGWAYEYENRSMGDWLDLIESSSKGRFTKFEVQGPGKPQLGKSLWPYSKKWKWVNRTAAEVAAIKAKRQPRTAAQKRRTFTRNGRRHAYGAGGLPVRPVVG